MVDLVEIQRAVDQYLEHHPGLFVVDIQLKGPACTVVIDHDSEPLSIDMCSDLNRCLREALGEAMDDFEIEVSSAGLTTPLVMPRQYHKYIGKRLEVLARGGVKEKGRLVEVLEDSFVLAVDKMVKPEGAKRKQLVTEEHTYTYDQVKKATYLIEF